MELCDKFATFGIYFIHLFRLVLNHSLIFRYFEYRIRCHTRYTKLNTRPNWPRKLISPLKSELESDCDVFNFISWVWEHESVNIDPFMSVGIFRHLLRYFCKLMKSYFLWKYQLQLIVILFSFYREKRIRTRSLILFFSGKKKNLFHHFLTSSTINLTLKILVRGPPPPVL